MTEMQVGLQKRLTLINNPVQEILPGLAPAYFTEKGAMYCGDARDLLRYLPAGSVNLVMTSPPYPLVFKKEYDNVDEDKYVSWIMTFVREIRRVLRKDGSFVLNLGGVWRKGAPVRSLVHYQVAMEISKIMPLAQEFFWYNPRKYSEDMHRLIRRGLRATVRPSGHNITPKFALDRGGSIPSNLIQAGNTDSSSEYFKKSKQNNVRPHPARFPKEMPEFFIRLATDPDDIVLDPFAGSNMTGWVAQSLGRRWIGFEIDQGYVNASALRFPAIYLAPK